MLKMETYNSIQMIVWTDLQMSNDSRIINRIGVSGSLSWLLGHGSLIYIFRVGYHILPSYSCLLLVT